MVRPATRTLEAFVATARLGSLAAASAHVGLSVAALSRRLAMLETQIGVRLLERVPRGVILTDAGSTYLAHATAVLERLDAAANELRVGRSVVRVTTLPAFATRWLVPRLSRFLAQHPGIEVDIRTSAAFERLDDGAFNVAIRMALNSEIDRPPLLPVHLMPVWRTGLEPAIVRPSDVLGHTLFGPSHRPEFWREWLELMMIEEAVGIRSVDALLLYEHVLNGLGVAIGIQPLIDGLLSERRLTALATHRIRSTRSFFLLEATTSSVASRLFCRWLHEEAKAEAVVPASMNAPN